MVKCPLDVHDEVVMLTVKTQQFAYYCLVDHGEEAKKSNYI